MYDPPHHNGENDMTDEIKIRGALRLRGKAIAIRGALRLRGKAIAIQQADNIRTKIYEFDRDATRAQYTDTGDVWDLLHFVADHLGEAVHCHPWFLGPLHEYLLARY